jgi:biotin operon repressor
MSKNSTKKSDFYLPLLNALKETTNLSKIREKLNISKQNLNFYLRRLKEKGFIEQKGRGWYEVVKESKNSTKYGILLSKDISRGHAYVWNIKLPKEIPNWSRRIEILKEKDYHFELVGALKTTPRIKVLGRKVWLCNDHLRIFERKGQSYYGKTAIESRKAALSELLLIVTALENKLGVFLRPFDFTWNREHYALIKNDLAIDQNRKGIIWRIEDQKGEWLIIDDSLGEGGELENIGKDAFKTNIPMQKWWNDQKETEFKVTPTFLMEMFNKIGETQILDKINIQKHQKVLDDMSLTLKEIRDSLKK